DDVRELPVPPAKVATVRIRLADTVLPQDREPAGGLDRVEEQDDPILAGESDHLVNSGEVRLVGSREVARYGEWGDAVVRRAVAPSACQRRADDAKEVHPHRVEAGCPAV